MKANGRFFGIMFIFNMILGLVGFLITWGIRVLTSEAIVGIVICCILFFTVADYINIFVVKKSKLKMPYCAYGITVHLVFFIVPTILTMLI